MEILIVLGLFIVAVACLVTEKVPVEIVTLSLLATLILFGILEPREAFAGFGSDLIVILGSVFVICGALQRSGILASAVTVLLRFSRFGPKPLAILLMAIASVTSAFMNNTTVTAMLLPAVDTVAIRARISSSKLMMPLAFGSILGGTCTLIGTSTNVAVSGYLERAGLAPLGLFELAPAGLVIVLVGLIYMAVAGWNSLPDESTLTHAPSSRGPNPGLVSEVVVLPGATVVSQRLRDADLGKHYGLLPLAVIRQGRPVSKPLSDVVLAVGDVLLVKASMIDLQSLRARHGKLMPLGDSDSEPMDDWRAWCLLAVFALAIILNTSIGLPLAAGLLIAALAAVMLGCVSSEKAVQSIDWRLLILIGGMTGFGAAMETSGAALWLANGMIILLGPLGVMGVLSGFFVLTIVLTQPMSNAAAAMVVAPIALTAASAMDADPRTFGIAVMLAASISFITPFEPSCMLVYSPGRYRFRDFIVVGGGLTILLTLVVVPLIPILWPL